MKNLFQVIPEDFFKPFTSKYKQTYQDYFEVDDDELCFDDVTYIRDAREKEICFLRDRW